ncbi:hypothetical protein RIF29_15635 [Crotalaria pallida]|uniref:RNase H type-1 domain-containing protein n=1 Tax=Crotalaria pallida TaxID=3830 RepID=A0AAN9IJ95_CROPI
MPRCCELAWRLCRGVAPFGSVLSMRIEQSKEADFQGWLKNHLMQSNKDALVIIFNVLHAILFRRNEWLHNKRRLTMEQVLEKANNMMMMIPPIQSTPSTTTREEVSMNDFDGATVYFDASLKGGATGFGRVAVDMHGNFMAAAVSRSKASMDAKMGEARALQWTLEILNDIGLSHVRVFMDCLILIEAWKNDATRKSCSYFHEVLQECLSVVPSLVSFQFLHTARSNNAMADRLAKATHVMLEIGNDSADPSD